MNHVSKHLRQTVKQVLPLLKKITDEQASVKLAPHKWSKKEIIGHLLDSACNNQQKFLRTMLTPELQFVGYQQNEWVVLQNYNAVEWTMLIGWWQCVNEHIAHIIHNAPKETLTHTIQIVNDGPFTLEFIMADYVEHLKHHLKQILPDINLKSSFVNVYASTLQ